MKPSDPGGPAYELYTRFKDKDYCDQLKSSLNQGIKFNEPSVFPCYATNLSLRKHQVEILLDWISLQLEPFLNVEHLGVNDDAFRIHTDQTTISVTDPISESSNTTPMKHIVCGGIINTLEVRSKRKTTAAMKTSGAHENNLTELTSSTKLEQAIMPYSLSFETVTQNSIKHSIIDSINTTNDFPSTKPTKEVLTTNDSNSNDIITRISAIFVTLVMRQYIMTTDLILLITRLCNISQQLPTNRLLVVKVRDITQFPTYLLNSNHLYMFLTQCMNGILPILKVLGGTVCAAFADSGEVIVVMYVMYTVCVLRLVLYGLIIF